MILVFIFFLLLLTCHSLKAIFTMTFEAGINYFCLLQEVGNARNAQQKTSILVYLCTFKDGDLFQFDPFALTICTTPQLLMLIFHNFVYDIKIERS